MKRGILYGYYFVLFTANLVAEVEVEDIRNNWSSTGYLWVLSVFAFVILSIVLSVLFEKIRK